MHGPLHVPPRKNSDFFPVVLKTMFVSSANQYTLQFAQDDFVSNIISCSMGEEIGISGVRLANEWFMGQYYRARGHGET